MNLSRLRGSSRDAGGKMIKQNRLCMWGRSINFKEGKRGIIYGKICHTKNMEIYSNLP